METKFAVLPAAASLFAVMSLSGCMTAGPNSQDPYEDFNRQMFAFNEGLDKAVIEPVAYSYRAVTNEPVREGVGNFTHNLGEPLTFVNHVLQGKLPDAGATFGRFVLNTTIGIAGVFDPASSLGLAKTDEDFGQTLGVWGVQSGPLLVLPVLGPTTPRDIIGRGGDAAGAQREHKRRRLHGRGARRRLHPAPASATRRAQKEGYCRTDRGCDLALPLRRQTRWMPASQIPESAALGALRRDPLASRHKQSAARSRPPHPQRHHRHRAYASRLLLRCCCLRSWRSRRAAVHAGHAL